jgi:hypothetical protein
MLKEIKVLLEEGTHKSKHGSVFENLIRAVLEKDRYNIIQNVHDAGLEIDLLAEHKTKNEILYAECKAKEKPKSTEIKNFIYAMDYGVEDKMPDYGYFIHTQELDRQAATLSIKLSEKKKNITFIGPNELINILEDIGKIIPFKDDLINNLEISKLILSYSPEGFHYILILQKGSLAQYFTTLDAKSNKSVPRTIQEFYQRSIKELSDLEIFEVDDDVIEVTDNLDERDIVLQIRESENWYEHTPASFHHFIGRLNLRRNLKGFLEKVRTGNSDKRIFFLDGKSGWGKSSLLAELKGSSLNLKYWKGRLFVSAVDTRSATTANYIGLAFRKMVDEAIASGFIEKNIFSKDIIISSPHDILADKSIKALFKELKRSKKILVLIFDQFEDQFRKENLFDAFYKFCLDVDSYKENLVVGFSWKSEINIPIGNPAHPKFIQLREYAYQITIPSFSQNDVKQIINQLEESIKKSIGVELQNRLIQSSQGFPWLAKKLCIHTYNQYRSGKSIDEIIEEELNYKELFENDLSDLSGEESKALIYIAKRAYDGNPFEISEYETIDQEVVNSLIHKRLIIRTGSTYNIYWDIFRDFIVTKEIPVIGESYILRNSAKACLDCFLTFKIGETHSLLNLCNNYPNDISENSMGNILIELRSIGLVKKISGLDEYSVTPKVQEVSQVFFTKYITKKLSNYTPYFELLKIKKEQIDVVDIVNVLKSIFKTEKFEDMTWNTYAKYLIIWFKMSDLEIKNKIVDIIKGRGNVSIKNKYEQIPYYSPFICMKAFEKYLEDSGTISQRKIRDLILMDLVSEDGETVYSETNIQKRMVEEARKNKPINQTYELLKYHGKLKSNDIIDKLGSTLKAYKSEISKKQVSSILLSWANFLLNYEKDGNVNIVFTNKKRKLGAYFLSFSPSYVIDTIIDVDNNYDIQDKRKVYDMIFLGLLNEVGNNIELSQNALKILNSVEPELELSLFIEKNPHLEEFKTVYEKCGDQKLETLMREKAVKQFFKGYSESSIKTKLSIYQGWLKYKQKNSSLQHSI